ncbi:MAG: DUF1272 domain-containing protein [Granulosicoccus sp.]|nr:DUF1272 domain-containing protein [Granulosicoccus sp.]
MLVLKPNCECCDKDLQVTSTDAMICSYECTFCRTCVEQILKNVCPNCGGGFVARPIRPKVARRPGTSVAHQPPSDKRVNTSYSIEELREFAETTRNIAPENR